jgi:hypothetical protein
MGHVSKKCYYFSEQFEIRMAAQASDWSDIFYFSRTTVCEVSRLCRNISLGVLKKCCYFSERLIIQYGLHGSDWSRHFWFCPQTVFIGSHQTWQMCSSKCSEKFLKSVVTSWSVPKSKMGVLLSNWPRHVLLIFQENSIQTLQICSSKSPIFVLYI